MPKFTKYKGATLGAILMAASAGANAAGTICLSADVKSPFNGTSFNAFTFEYTPGTVSRSANNVPLTGKVCAVLTDKKLGTYSECWPSVGAVIIDENQIEISSRGNNASADFGPTVVESYNYHISLDPNTLSGTLYGDVQATVNGKITSYNGNGTITKVACTGTTADGGNEALQSKALRGAIAKLIK